MKFEAMESRGGSRRNRKPTNAPWFLAALDTVSTHAVI